MKKNSVSELDKSYPDVATVEIRNVKGYGPPEFFDLTPPAKPTLAAAPALAPGPAFDVTFVSDHDTDRVPTAAPPAAALSAWQEVLVGWRNAQGQLAPGSVKFVLQKKNKEVAHVTYDNLRTAMQNANVN
jgi:hypothetical protein